MPNAEPSRRIIPHLYDAARRGHYWWRDYVYAVQRQLRSPLERRVPARFTTGDRAPVVLLAGVIEPWTMLLPVAEALHKAGHPVHVIPELALNIGSVPEAAAIVRRVIAERGLTKVILVAHSKGGLIGKLLLVDDDEGRIDRLIAIATPFHGSKLARLVPWKIIRALRPDEPTIMELKATSGVNARITSIYPGFDPHVPESSHLEGATNVEVAAMGHFRILRDPDVLAAVVAAAG